MYGHIQIIKNKKNGQQYADHFFKALFLLIINSQFKNNIGNIPVRRWRRSLIN